MQTLIKTLREFKLSGMAECLPERMIYALNNKLSYQELFELLCDDEKSKRRNNNYQKRKAAAKLPSMKRLEDFAFSFQPSVDQRIMNDLATCQFIANKENVIFTGSSGTGKTHLAIALAVKALTKEYSVYFSTVSDLLYNLHIARADNQGLRIKKVIDSNC
jgi:DNA replication protein DnaC